MPSRFLRRAFFALCVLCGATGATCTLAAEETVVVRLPLEGITFHSLSYSTKQTLKGYTAFEKRSATSCCGQAITFYLHVKNTPEMVLTDNIDNVGLKENGRGDTVLFVDFNERGKVLFSSLTERIANKEYGNEQLIAILLDGKFISAPRVHEKIFGISELPIFGNHTENEVEQIVARLNQFK